MTHATLKNWDRDSYYRLAESGAFRPDERVELVEGIITQLSPQKKPHASLIGRVNMQMATRFSDTHVVRVQCPLDLGDSQPEPDIAIVTIDEEENCPIHPRVADLLIEVTDSSDSYDRVDKASLYAKYAFPELWIILVGKRAVEICRDPQPDPTAPYGFNYAYRVQVSEGTPVSPLFAPAEAFDLFSSRLK